MFIVQEYKEQLYRLNTDTGETWKLDTYRDEWEPVENANHVPDRYIKIGHAFKFRSPIQPDPCASCGVNLHEVATFTAFITPALVQFAFEEHQRDEAERNRQAKPEGE